MYSGPYLVIRKINEVNYVVQRTRRSEPIITHVDKLKACADQSHESWLSRDSVEREDEAVGPVDQPPTRAVRTRKRGRPAVVPERGIDNDSDEEEIINRPKRRARRPRRFDDFV
jgi:hypothetical protein